MFERFTDEARRALTVAQEEARRLDHDFIGTEHLLLGLLAAGEGGAVEALAEAGVTLDEARVSVEQRVHPAKAGTHGPPPFTPLAKKALERSLRAALTLNDSFIGPEHMLLGLLDVPDGGGAHVLTELAGSLDHVRETVQAQIGKSPPPSLRREGGTRRSRLWVTRSGSTGKPESGPVAGPRCPHCKASLGEHVRYQAIHAQTAEPSEVPDAVEVAPGPPLTLTAVYCDQCGTTIGLA